MSEFHAEASQATASERLVQGPFVEARSGFEPTTFLAKGDESTNDPPRSTRRILSGSSFYLPRRLNSKHHQP